MVHAANKENNQSINQITIAEIVSLEEVDQRIPPYLLLSREDDNDFGDIGKKKYFRSVLLQPMLSNASLLREVKCWR